VHLNNAGSSLPVASTLDTVQSYLREEALFGGYEQEESSRPQLDAIYSRLARMLGCDDDEVALAESATLGWQLLFHSIPFEAGDYILTTHAEYASSYLAFLQARQRHRVHVHVIPHDRRTGRVCLSSLADLLAKHPVRLVSIAHVPTNGGLVQPAAEVGALCARHPRALFLLDACQTAGQLPLDVRALRCDMLTATGRKYLRAPRGTGFLYVRRETMLGQLGEPALLDLHGAQWGPSLDTYELRADARRFENWEASWALRLGLGEAVRYYLDEVRPGVAWQRIRQLATELRSRLSALAPRVQLRDLGGEEHRCGLVTLSVGGHESAEALKRLAAHLRSEHRINVSVSAASSTLLDMSERGLDAVLRASVHYYNTESELERFVAALQAFLRDR